MFIIIQEDILKRTDLNGDEKILLSYIRLLTQSGKQFFGSEKWCLRHLGSSDVESKRKKFIERGFCSENFKGELIFNDLPSVKGIPFQPAVRSRTFNQLEKQIERLKKDGWAITGESENIVQFWKDDKVINLPKYQIGDDHGE